ncbi:metal ABC transporter solute-binding protein, Zn/Mn family [Paenibacillus apiarius]|uniref:metal ABC transporter solute-binding protein, Zn/Mn family n=1 Tax=Paenibacillus apiarius TaxID=46240 RepID=UPI00197D0972|nr:zinc ABC transporter substrate-binding protein [Paenibacillus apiarius]MBN3525449.1 zinc ABC transporter substrate-binding protein [Paenibacillus apiarius]
MIRKLGKAASKVKWNSAIKRLLMTVLFLSVALALAACGKATEEKPADGGVKADSKLKVTATIGMIADVVKEVGGDHVDVIGLMGPGVDPHLYKASQGDIKKLDDADIVFYNGLHLEGKMVDILEKMSESKTTVPVSKTIPEPELLADPALKESHDPHIWFNVKNWMKATEVIRDTLINEDVVNADEYKQRAEAYLSKLTELDSLVRARVAEIPEASRVLVTAHDAFGYFGEAYGMKVMGLQGISTASEYGSKDVSDLRDYLIENKIKAVFIESSVPQKAIEAVIEGARKKGHEVVIGGELFSDAMGEPGTAEGTYIGMVRHNVNTIVEALK